MLFKTCSSCGITLEQPQDYALNDENSLFCRYCADDEGNLKPYEEIHEAMASFLMFTQELDEATAEKNADLLLKECPSWKKH